MPVCPVDEKGFCSRHNVVHRGRLLEIALMDNDWAEGHRLRWDRKASPSLGEKAVHFGKAFLRRAASGSQNATDEQYAERISICDGCPHVNKSSESWECSLCGCPLKESETWPGKARWASEKCDDGRWPVLPMVALDGGCNRCG